MGNIEVQWYVEGRVAYIQMRGIITLDEMLLMNSKITDHIEEGVAGGAPLVHFVVDDSGVTSTQLKINDVNQVLKVIRHPSFGWALSIGDENPMVKVLVYLVSQIARIRYRRFATQQDAIAFLKAQVQDVNWSLADDSIFQSGEQAQQ